MTKDLVKKYLANFAESECQLLDTFPERQFQDVLILPAYNELPDFLDAYINGQFHSLLLILVINQPDTVTDSTTQHELYSYVSDNSELLWQNEHLSLHECQDPASAILCIRRYDEGLRLNPKHGVGLARKIAADCALRLVHDMVISSHWIASTDADASLPDNYFQNLRTAETTAAITFEYKHEVNQGPVSMATQRYEQALRYYQAGLQWAGSPYAFHSLGSCLAFNSYDYASARGFPKRAGGEDFYLLNKLAKIGIVSHCDDIQVAIQSRQSDRVPFGTGPAISKILALDSTDEYRYYDPAVFVELKSCLDSLNSLKPADEINSWEGAFAPHHFSTLEDFGIGRIFEHQLHQKFTPESLNPHLHIWFDGLLTLRFIHAMRDLMHPDILLNDALEKSPFSTK